MTSLVFLVPQCSNSKIKIVWALFVQQPLSLTLNVFLKRCERLPSIEIDSLVKSKQITYNEVLKAQLNKLAHLN